MTPTGVAPEALRGFVPLDALSPISLDRLAARTAPEHLVPGQLVFRKGHIDRHHVFLLEGALELRCDRPAHPILVAGSRESLHAVGHRQPRPYTVRARTQADIVRIDSQELDMLLTWDQSRGYQVGELTAPADADAVWSS